MSQNLKYQIEKILTNVPKEKVIKLQTCLDNGQINKNSDVYDFDEHLNFLTEEIRLVRQLFDLYDDGKILSLLLEFGKESHQLRNKLETMSTLVWTSPLIDENAPQTFNTMLEMIRGCQRTVTIVGYAIWGDAKDIDPNAPQMKIIFEELAKLIQSKKNVELFFDKDDNFEKLKNNVKKMWTSGVPLPKIFGFQKQEKYSSLHAKMLLIDDSNILITSANMTGRAITRNVELGIRTKGIVAKNARNLINRLVNAGYFKEESW